MIEVILKEPVDNLGHRGDVVRVADGYARNYLLPRKLALQVTSGNQRQIDAEKKRAAEREVARQQIVARVAIGHADDVAAVAEIVDGFLQDDFDHDG